jgi:hypothetical protein
MRNLTLAVLFSLSCVYGQVQVIPQVADGAGWATTIVLTNTTATAQTDVLWIAQNFENSIIGRYDDTFVKRDGRWLFARREDRDAHHLEGLVLGRRLVAACAPLPIGRPHEAGAAGRRRPFRGPPDDQRGILLEDP